MAMYILYRRRTLPRPKATTSNGFEVPSVSVKDGQDRGQEVSDLESVFLL